MTTNALVFDLDGTLFDTAPGIKQSINSAFISANVSITVEEMDTLIGPPLRSLVMKLLNQEAKPELIEAVIAAFAEDYDSEGYKLSTPYDGVYSTLSELTESGIRCYIATNKRRIPTLRILEYTGLAVFFTGVVTLDLSSPPFPSKAEATSFLIDSYSLESRHVVFVGDSRDDARAAFLNDISFAAVSYGYGDALAQSEWPVGCRLDAFAELSPIVLG